MGTLSRGTFTALVTPFASDGSVDFDALGRLVGLQLEGEVEGLVPCGTTGEAATLTNEEHLEVIRFVTEQAAGRATIFAGVGGNDTRNVINLSRRASALGVDGVLAVAPYYNKPTQVGMFEHFTAIADAVQTPVILYNVPGRTSSNLGAATVLRLAAHPNIAGIKEASGDLSQVMAILSGRPDDFLVLSGEDDLTLAMICMGGDGVISVVSNEVPGRMSNMVRNALAGNLEQARAEHYRLLDLMNANFIESNPIPAKEALAMMGHIEPVYRLPLVRMGVDNRARLASVLRDLGLA